ncbi:proline iminopeptidase-family hydrolase [Chlamydiota bacterium]
MKRLLLLTYTLLTSVLMYGQTIETQQIKEIGMQAVKVGGVQLVTLDNGFKVWTKRVGEGPIKILLLHGGPGCTHEYFECFEDFFPREKFQIIYYDQLGSHYSDQPEDTSLWTVERFCDEVEQVRQALGLKDFYLYGQSWGGILAIEYALKYQSNLKGLILSNITGSVLSYETYLKELRAQLPQEVRDQLSKYEATGDFSHPEYEKIMFEQVYTRYLCRLDPWPEPLLRTFRHLSKPVYNTIQGPNEFIVTGNFKDWNRWNDLAKINIPTLLICGRYDTMSPKDTEKMGTLIPGAKVKICENGSHLSMYDDQETYFKELHTFLNNVEAQKVR